MRNFYFSLSRRVLAAGAARALPHLHGAVLLRFGPTQVLHLHLLGLRGQRQQLRVQGRVPARLRPCTTAGGRGNGAAAAKDG